MPMQMKMHSVHGPTPPESPRPPAIKRTLTPSNLLSNSLRAMMAGSPKRPSPTASIKFPAPNAEPTGDLFLNVIAAISEAAKKQPKALADMGFLQPLVAVLHPGSASQAVQALALDVLTLTSSHAENQAALRESGVLHALLRILAGDDGDLVLGALRVLRPLCRDPSTKDMLRDVGGLKVLVDLINSVAPDLSAQRDGPSRVLAATVRVLSNLAASPSNQEALRGLGAIRPLVHLLDSPLAERTAAQIATALSNLAVGNQANKDAIRVAGGVPRLVHLLHGGMDAAMASTEALGNLAVKNNNNKNAIRTAGGVEALAELFKSTRPSRQSSERSPPTSARGLHAPHARRQAEGISGTAHWGTAARGRNMTPSPTSTPSSSRSPSPAPATDGGESTSCSPPDTSRAESAPSRDHSRASSPPPVEGISRERVAWALRNATANNGLSTAAMVAAGVTLKEIELPRAEHVSHPTMEKRGNKTAPPPMPSQPPMPPPQKPPGHVSVTAAAAAAAEARNAIVIRGTKHPEDAESKHAPRLGESSPPSGETGRSNAVQEKDDTAAPKPSAAHSPRQPAAKKRAQTKSIGKQQRAGARPLQQAEYERNGERPSNEKPANAAGVGLTAWVRTAGRCT